MPSDETHIRYLKGISNQLNHDSGTQQVSYRSEHKAESLATSESAEEREGNGAFNFKKV
jgi:hypothetical protein